MKDGIFLFFLFFNSFENFLSHLLLRGSTVYFGILNTFTLVVCDVIHKFNKVLISDIDGQVKCSGFNINLMQKEIRAYT